MLQRANQEQWAKHRQEAYNKGMEKAEQKAAVIQSDNAATAQRIKAKLLRKLEKEIDALPDLIGSETRQTATENNYTGGRNPKLKSTKEVAKNYNLKALTAAYKDLVGDMNLNADTEPVRIIIDV